MTQALIDQPTLDELTESIGQESVSFAIEAFLQELNDALPILTQAPELDPSGAQSQAHSLKSSSRLVGALALSERCRELENNLEAKNFTAISSQDFKTLAQQTQQAYQTLINESPKSSQIG